MKKILLIGAQSADYLNIMTINGLMSLESISLDIFPDSNLILRSDSDYFRDSLRGNGFTIFFENLKKPNVIHDIHHALSNTKYDLIILSDIFVNFYFVSLLMKYKRVIKKLVIIDGSDAENLFPFQKSFLGIRNIFQFPNLFKDYYYFKREYTFKTIESRYWNIAPRFYSKKVYNTGEFYNLKKISFSIPESKIINPKSLTKKKIFVSHIVDNEISSHISGSNTGYLFSNEDEYFRDIQESKYGITTKRSGWDCLRHYEIAANGAVICFKDLNKKPKYCAPHDLIPGKNCISYSDYNDLMNQINNITDDKYKNLQQETYKWISAKTCRNLARHLISESNI